MSLEMKAEGRLIFLNIFLFVHSTYSFIFSLLTHLQVNIFNYITIIIKELMFIY